MELTWARRTRREGPTSASLADFCQPTPRQPRPILWRRRVTDHVLSTRPPTAYCASHPAPPLAPTHPAERESSSGSSPWRSRPSPPHCAAAQISSFRGRGLWTTISAARSSGGGSPDNVGAEGRRSWPPLASRRGRQRRRSPRGPSPAPTSRRPGSARAGLCRGRKPGRCRSTRTCSRPRSPPSPPCVSCLETPAFSFPRTRDALATHRSLARRLF